jgi:hypothetical protein
MTYLIIGLLVAIIVMNPRDDRILESIRSFGKYCILKGNGYDIEKTREDVLDAERTGREWGYNVQRKIGPSGGFILVFMITTLMWPAVMLIYLLSLKFHA